MLSKLFQRRAAKKDLLQARAEFELAAAAFVAANRAARAAGKMLTPEMEAAELQLRRAQKRLSVATSSLNRVTGGPPSVSLTETVARKVRSTFPPEVHAEAIRLLEKECGRNLPFHDNAEPKELDRVRLAVVKLSHGDLVELKNQVATAKADWRDVLLFAEQPEEMNRGLLDCSKLDPEERDKLKARDKKQYEEWLHDDDISGSKQLV